MLVGVQYCGGCNPRFNRMAMIEQLQKELPSLSIYYFGFGPQQNPDFTVVVAGCSSACTAHTTPEGKMGKFVVTKPEDYLQLVAVLHAAGCR